MVIRSRNRLYYFDRHISDAFLRLTVVFLALFTGVSAWLMLLRTDPFIDAVFWPRLQDEIADLAGKEVSKLGMSEQSLLTRVMHEMEQDRAGITKFPEYAERLSPNNQAIELIRLRLTILRLMVRSIGFVFLAFFIVLFILLRVIYGGAERRWKIFHWIYGQFNKDGASRQPYGLVRSLTPFQRKMFEIAFASSKGNPDGSLEFDIGKVAALLWPGEDALTDRRRGMIAIAFTELCDEFFYFQISGQRGMAIRTYCPLIPFEDQVKREWVRDTTGREIEAFTAGRFRFSPPLYEEHLRNRYPKLPHPVAYALDDRRHPFAFRAYLTLWELLVERNRIDLAAAGPDAAGISSTVELPLMGLIERACLEMSAGHDDTLLEQIHQDLGKLKELGFIRAWTIEENGDPVHPSWYKSSNLFVYDATSNTYHMNSGLITRKIYRFEMASWTDLEKIHIVRRRCAFVDNLNTPCSRQAMAGSPYCKRHAKALDFETPKLFYEKVKALTAPNESDPSVQDPSGTPQHYSAEDLDAAPAVIIPPPPPSDPEPPKNPA